MRLNLYDVITKIEDYFGTKVIVLDNVWNTESSKVFIIEINGKEFVLKLKQERKKRDERIRLLKLLKTNNIRIADIIVEWDGIVVKEKIEGMSLKEYLTKTNILATDKHLNHDFKNICRDIGLCLNNFHNAAKVPDNYIESIIEDKITEVNTLINDILSYDNQQIDKKKLKEIKDFFHKFLLTNEYHKFIKLTHNDFHNSNNIMLHEVEGKMLFYCFLDYDSLDFDFLGEDLAQIYMYILCENDKYFDIVLESYLKTYNYFDRELIKNLVNVFYLKEILYEILYLLKDNSDFLSFYWNKLLEYYKKVVNCSNYVVNKIANKKFCEFEYRTYNAEDLLIKESKYKYLVPISLLSFLSIIIRFLK